GGESAAVDRRPQCPGRNARTNNLRNARSRGQSRHFSYLLHQCARRPDGDNQQIVPLPTELAVAADYGLTVLSATSPQAYQVALFILSIHGQHVLAKYGFAALSLPQ